MRGCGEMVYTLVSGTSAAMRGGSSPLIRTKTTTRLFLGRFVVL